MCLHLPLALSFQLVQFCFCLDLFGDRFCDGLFFFLSDCLFLDPVSEIELVLELALLCLDHCIELHGCDQAVGFVKRVDKHHLQSLTAAASNDFSVLINFFFPIDFSEVGVLIHPGIDSFFGPFDHFPRALNDIVDKGLVLCLCVVVSGVRLVPGRLFVIFIFSLVCILKLLLHLLELRNLYA